MDVCINAEQLRKALKEIEIAEENGYGYSLAVLRLATAGRMLDECTVEFDGLVVKGHPTDGHFHFGRSSHHRYSKLVDGEILELDEPIRR